MTDRQGNRVEHYEYTGFGREQYKEPTSAFQVSNRYTGQVLDEDTGLYYYNARYYDPELGRFIQPDSIVPGASNPQSLNRYSYVNNNPLNLTDPSGHGGIGGFFTAVFRAEVRYWSSGETWKSIGIGFALGGGYGAVGAAAVGNASTEIGASMGYIFGPETGNNAAFAATIAGAIFGAAYGIGYSGATTTQQIIIATSAATSVASTSAGYAGDQGLADALGYASLAVAIGGSSLNAYFSKQGTWRFPEGLSQALSDYAEAGIGGILEGSDEAQVNANTSKYPWLTNPSNGPVVDVMENVWRKLFFGFGDSMGKQFAGGVNQMQANTSVHGFSAGSGIIAFAGVHGRFSGVSSIDLAASPVEYGIARWSAATSHAQLRGYRTRYFDVSSIYAPSYNPAKFLSGFIGYRHSIGTYYP